MTLPRKVVVSARVWNVTEHEGLITFSDANGMALGAFSDRVSFERNDGNYGDGAWSVSVQGHDGRIRVGALIGLYRLVESEYGGPYGKRLTPDGRIGREQVHPWAPKVPGSHQPGD